jgi:hypothetical protein
MVNAVEDGRLPVLPVNIRDGLIVCFLSKRSNVYLGGQCV